MNHHHHHHCRCNLCNNERKRHKQERLDPVWISLLFLAYIALGVCALQLAERI